jgi:hypothetical protein
VIVIVIVIAIALSVVRRNMPNYPGKKNARKLMAAADKAMRKNFKSKTKGGPSEQEKAKAKAAAEAKPKAAAKTSAVGFDVKMAKPFNSGYGKK